MTHRKLSVEQIAKKKVAWGLFWSFFFLTAFTWLFSEHLAIILLYTPGNEVVESVFFPKVQIIIAVGLTLLFGAFASLVYMHHSLSFVKKAPPPISREAVSDLMLSREQFRKLYDSSPVPYFLMDDAGNISNPNVATLRFLGGTVEECTASNFFSLLAEEEKAQKTIALLRAKVERSVPISQEEMCIHPLNKKEERHALVSIYSLERTSQVAFKHLVAIVDVSKEKENEQNKSEFLLLASHQLRTPLTTIKWYIDYLLSNKKVTVDGLVREYLEQIYIGNERMIELITTLLTVSRIEMGTLAPDYKTVKINEVIKDILDELATDVQKRGTKIQVLTQGDDAVIMDHTMVRIIIHNLLTNAVKYTPNNGVVIVDSKFSHHTWSIAVSDTGCGIPYAEQHKIFTKMFRAKNAKKVSTAGTGLGLYMSKAFTEKLGGRIDFHSEEGKGTTFTISLPRVAPDA